MTDLLKRQIRVMPPLERQLLYYLTQNKGRYVDHKTIPIIGMDKPETVTVYICRIRKRIPQLILETKRGSGYRYMGCL